MSMPALPEIDPELTRDQALHMILASIAMEEMALSHIINAEGEKLQYVLGTHGNYNDRKPSVEEVLAVNESVNCLLDSVSQNQMLLKSKMEKALCALSKPKPWPYGPTGPTGPPGPPGPPCLCRKCSAVFRGYEKNHLWCAGTALHWKATDITGKCVCFDPSDKTQVMLHAKGRYLVNFAANVRPKSNCPVEMAIRLNMRSHYKQTELFTLHESVAGACMKTVSIGGVMVEVGDYAPVSLSVRLVSNEHLLVEDSMFSIMEV